MWVESRLDGVGHLAERESKARMRSTGSWIFLVDYCIFTTTFVEILKCFGD